MEPHGFDPSVPSPARIWNYYIGGKDNFAVDRAVAEQVIKVLPTAPLVARMTRRFLVRVVHELAVTHQIRQFIDIGSGLPTADNTHQVAQRAAPGSRIVYMDNDPVVIAHANALLTSTPEGSCDYLLADVRDVDALLAGAARTLDFSRPVAVLMLQLLHFVPDHDGPYDIVRQIIGAVPAGSFLILVHGASDADPRAAAELTKMAQMSSVPLRLRSRDEVSKFFDGLDIIGPGLVSGAQWLAAKPGSCCSDARVSYGYTGVARKP